LPPRLQTGLSGRRKVLAGNFKDFDGTPEEETTLAQRIKMGDQRL
jgi:hypothetical protein